MGITVSPDIAQEHIEKLLKVIKEIEIYIDDIATFSNSWEEHMQLLDKILFKLE